MKVNFAVVIPLANEQESFHPFIASLTEVLNKIESGKVFIKFIKLFLFYLF
mgnify:CR=1 FL=1